MSTVDTANVPATCFDEEEEHQLTQYYFGKSNYSLPRGILKSKENISKIHRSLKKKLKKYKLKKDSTDDPDVIDVSQALTKSLKLISPSCDTAIKFNYDKDRCENYLIKMVRRKETFFSCNKKETTNSTSTDKSLRMAEPNTKEKNPDESDVAKKQTNAFKLLMDSRNKSIGSNSPGKNRSLIEPETEAVEERKKIKIKHNLALHKLANAKGALRRKELEEIEEACVKVKMEKRAERLKKMLNRGKQKQRKKNKPNEKVISDSEDENINKISQEKCYPNTSSKKTSKQVALQCEKEIIPNGLLTEKSNPMIIPMKSRVLKEDLEFLSKLSPSIKKKENMLCYFQKVEKELDVISVDEVGKVDEQGIKVKIIMKTKRNKKHRKLNLKKETQIDIDCNENNSIEIEHSKHNNEEKNDKESRKRKRKQVSEPFVEDVTILNSHSNVVDPGQIVEGRPRRNIRRPVEYNDDAQHLSSSEDELHIFTPKKKKHILSSNTPDDRPKRKSLPNLAITEESEDMENITKNDTKNTKQEHFEDVANISKNSIKGTKQTKAKNAKLAPIFKKTQIDTVALEAKQKFLQSGMPDQLKKIIAQQKVQDTVAEQFYPVVHVQQNEATLKVPLLYLDLSNDSENHFDIQGLPRFNESDITKLLHKNDTDYQIVTLLTEVDVLRALKNIKESYAKFPVYRTYKTLINKKNGDHKDLNSTDVNSSSEVLDGLLEAKQDQGHLTWCSKYRATSTKQILGNFDSVQELRKWLIAWTCNDASPKDSQDNSDSDFDEYDTDSRDSMKISNNLLALTGPVGSGKTSSVYAVATELSIKVIEVNVSSKRTGKIILQDLQEATQSHKVNRGKGGSSENSQEMSRLKSSQNPKKHKKKSKLLDGIVAQNKSDSQSISQEDGRTGMSLILIDDADVVFDQDDGFISAIAQLIQCSKRPVILVVTSLNCQHLHKFLLSGTILKMHSLSPRILGTWLDIMCLVDTKLCWPGFGEKCLEFYKGDIRKAINCLHFLLGSETQKRTSNGIPSTPEELNMISVIEDENSNFSWVDNDQSEHTEELTQSNIFTRQHQADLLIKSLSKYPLDRFNVWWSLPSILKLNNHVDIKEKKEAKKSLKELEALSDVIDSISMAECFSYKVKPDTDFDISSSPWLSVETDSVSEKENIDFVNNHIEVVNQMAHDLVETSLNKTRRIFMTHDNHIQYPGLTEQRARDKIIVRHDTLTNAINPSSVLDRKALALDYWSTCRGICRTEREKTDKSSKRHKRFTHYLKSSMVMNKSMFDKLCDSLQPLDEG